MNILVIGNGFDITHGLKTTYKDFLLACQNNNLPDEFKEKCQINLWLKHFLARKSELGETWIDLEKEIFEVIKKLNRINFGTNDNIPYNCKSLDFFKKDQHFNLSNLNNILLEDHTYQKFNLCGYYLDNSNSENSTIYFQNSNSLINFLYQQLRDFTNIFRHYLENELSNNLTEPSKYNLSLPNEYKNLSVLSFNYTNTCERLYGKMFDIKSYYVHGKINYNNDTCNLVLGTHSFDNKPQNENPRSAIPYEFNVFRKHNQRHKYGTIEAYQELLNELQKSGKPIFHVIGHSLDETDKNILEHLFLINQNAIINIYYHNEEAQENYINNITDIIGEKEVMTRVRLIYQHDKTRGILKEKVNV